MISCIGIGAGLAEEKNSRISIRALLYSGAFSMKMIIQRSFQYLALITAIFLLVFTGLMMGEQGLVHKRKLEEKRAMLKRENEQLASSINSLERKLTLLRTDPGTIEKTAKQKLGMARPEETVYVFTDENRGSGRKSAGLTLRSIGKRR